MTSEVVYILATLLLTRQPSSGVPEYPPKIKSLHQGQRWLF